MKIAFTFFILAIVSAILGFGGFSDSEVLILTGKILFSIFLTVGFAFFLGTSKWFQR
jgi:uncharacterized membrane protein YtjA (UPF0391 family)